jgi:UDP-3-O-[3-hydroxymyristoyl] glucosamine N-acyltransferase
VIVAHDFPEIEVATLRSSNPYLTFARAVELFYQPLQAAPGIDATARIAPSARIGEGASIAPYVVVEGDVEIGKNCTLYPFVHISRGVRIGDNFKAYAHVSVREFCRIGQGVILQDASKSEQTVTGTRRRMTAVITKSSSPESWFSKMTWRWARMPRSIEQQSGRLVFDAGAKIDNLVQIGHASDVGENSLLCAQVGLAGSSKIGKNVILTGQVGVAGHLEIGDGVIATAQTGIPSSVEAGKVISGYPAIDNKTWLKSSAVFKRLPELLKRIEALEKKSSM